MKKVKDKISKLLSNNSGMGVIEVVLIILVLVGLAIVFKTQISGIASGLYTSIRNQINGF